LDWPRLDREESSAMCLNLQKGYRGADRCRSGEGLVVVWYVRGPWFRRKNRRYLFGCRCASCPAGASCSLHELEYLRRWRPHVRREKCRTSVLNVGKQSQKDVTTAVTYAQ